MNVLFFISAGLNLFSSFCCHYLARELQDAEKEKEKGGKK